MKRFCALVMLMMASSSVQAGTISFSVGGHRVRIEAPRVCSSSSCASISIPGVYESRRKREDDKRDNVASQSPAPVRNPAPVTPAPAPAPIQQTPPALSKPVVASAPPTALPAITAPVAAATQEVVPPALPPPPPVPPVEPEIATQPCATPPDVRPAPPTLQVLLHEDSVDSPLGDWQTEGKGMVRIAECGRSLCGYAVKEGEQEKGEAILINMKAKSDSQWNGSIYSKESGGTYFGTMRRRGPSTLRVEACAFGNFYCKGNNWTRVTSKPMVTSNQIAAEPRS